MVPMWYVIALQNGLANPSGHCQMKLLCIYPCAMRIFNIVLVIQSNLAQCVAIDQPMKYKPCPAGN
eukprot:scaffold625227_cov45-Prasinocladus_malaysianus.AAC.1